MSKKVIGIISYLPDDTKTRKDRYRLLNNLIRQCNEIFNLPIYILIQNYTKEEQEQLEHLRNVAISPNFPRLGIRGAREILRNTFLKMGYDYLIMLDDDCQLRGSREDGINYIEQLESHPGCFGEFKTTLLKLFSISRELLEKEGFPQMNPEDGDGFEDRAFVNKLRIRYPDKRFVYCCSIEETSISTKDALSTWYKNQDLQEMISKTTDFIEKVKDNC